MKSANNNIHDTAVINPGAKIGNNVTIGPWAYIGSEVLVGDNCVIEAQVVIEGKTTIGNGNRFAHGATIGSLPQEYQQDEVGGPLTIGDNNIFKESAIVSSGSVDGGTRIGNNNLLMSCSYIGRDCILANHIVIDNYVVLSERIELGDRAIIGGLSWIHQDCKIGRMVMIGGRTKIVKDVPPYLLVDGNPASIFGINIVGLRRNGVAPEVRDEIKKAYKILYRSNFTMRQAIAQSEELLLKNPEIDYFIDFIRQSRQGILR